MSVHDLVILGGTVIDPACGFVPVAVVMAGEPVPIAPPGDRPPKGISPG